MPSRVDHTLLYFTLTEPDRTNGNFRLAIILDLTRIFHKIMHNLACLLIPQEIFPQSGVITDTPLLLNILVKHLEYANQDCAIFAQIYEMSGLNRETI